METLWVVAQMGPKEPRWECGLDSFGSENDHVADSYGSVSPGFIKQRFHN